MENTVIETIKKQEQVQVDLLQYSSGEGNSLFKGEHTLFISLAARPVHYLHAQDGKTHTGLYRRGEMLITPANTPLFSRWEGDENCLQIRITSEFMRDVARETVVGDCDLITLRPEFQTRNPQLESMSASRFCIKY